MKLKLAVVITSMFMVGLIFLNTGSISAPAPGWSDEVITEMVTTTYI
jgi:hypothetical protein